MALCAGRGEAEGEDAQAGGSAKAAAKRSAVLAAAKPAVQRADPQAVEATNTGTIREPSVREARSQRARARVLTRLCRFDIQSGDESLEHRAQEAPRLPTKPPSPCPA